MRSIIKLTHIQLIVILIFVLSKKLVRPFVLKGDFPNYIDIIVLSLPNLYEAIVGSIAVSYISLYINYRIMKKRWRLDDQYIYFLSILATAVYVLLQEFKVHNIGGNNVYDPYDVLFSVIGLGIGYIILHYLKPTLEAS